MPQEERADATKQVDQKAGFFLKSLPADFCTISRKRLDSEKPRSCPF